MDVTHFLKKWTDTITEKKNKLKRNGIIQTKLLRNLTVCTTTCSTNGKVSDTTILSKAFYMLFYEENSGKCFNF